MLRLFSTKAQWPNIFFKPSKPCHVDIHWKALDRYTQIGTHMPGFPSFLSFFASFCFAQVATSSVRVKATWLTCRHPLTIFKAKGAVFIVTTTLLSLILQSESHPAASSVAKYPHKCSCLPPLSQDRCFASLDGVRTMHLVLWLEMQL